MNPFVAWLSRLSVYASTPAIWGIFLAGAAIYLIANWRVRFLALLVQYLFIGVIFERIFDSRPELAFLKILVGWLVGGAVFLSARIREENHPEAQEHRLHWGANVPFRILSLLMMVVAAYLASQRYALPFIPPDLAPVCFVLGGLAILFMGTEEKDTAVVGVGMLNLLAALDIFYSVQDPSLVVTGMLVMVNLLVGLVISYLTVAEVVE